MRYPWDPFGLDAVGDSGVSRILMTSAPFLEGLLRFQVEWGALMVCEDHLSTMFALKHSSHMLCAA